MENKHWYKVVFYARMDDDDVHAMKECFYDAMDQAMAISECCCLEIDCTEDE